MITFVELLLPLVVAVEVLRRSSKQACNQHLDRAFDYPLTEAQHDWSS